MLLCGNTMHDPAMEESYRQSYSESGPVIVGAHRIRYFDPVEPP